MSDHVELKDNTVRVSEQLSKACSNILEECGAEIESETRRNTRVDTGQLKASWTHIVDGDECTIGSFLQNAIWEEYGTGVYAENGGRQTPWKYEYNGKKGRSGWRVTRGKKKNPKGLKYSALQVKPKLSKIANNILMEFLGGD